MNPDEYAADETDPSKFLKTLTEKFDEELLKLITKFSKPNDAVASVFLEDTNKYKSS